MAGPRRAAAAPARPPRRDRHEPRGQDPDDHGRPDAGPVTVRPARRADGPALLRLIRALAEFEKLPGPTDEAARRLLADAFGPRRRFEALLAEAGGEVVAYALFFPTYSTFLARPTLYLEDLFVHPDARRRGVARALLERLRELAVARRCGRLEWMALDWNRRAHRLFRSVGARARKEWRLFRVELERNHT